MRNETPEQTALRLGGESLEVIADRFNLSVDELRQYHKTQPFTFYALCSKDEKDEKN